MGELKVRLHTFACIVGKGERQSCVCVHCESVWGSEGVTPRILNFGTRWRMVVSSTPLSLFCLKRRLAAPNGKSRRCGEDEILLHLPITWAPCSDCACRVSLWVSQWVYWLLYTHIILVMWLFKDDRSEGSSHRAVFYYVSQLSHVCWVTIAHWLLPKL
jgi:hypothetical protein